MNLDGLTRREILRYTGAAATQLITSPVSVFAQYKQDLQPNCKYILPQVRAGLVSPNEYVDEWSRCLPEAVILRREGKLGGFLYNPTDEELVALHKKTLQKVSRNPAELNRWVQEGINTYHSVQSSGDLGILVPARTEVFGSGNTFYVAFSPISLQSNGLTNDSEMRSLSLHELQHVRDFSGGIRLGKYQLSRPDLERGRITVDFLQNLAELRAGYKELKYIFLETIIKKNPPVTVKYLAGRGVKYHKYWQAVQNAKTGLEKTVRDIQFVDFKGIIPERQDNIVTIYFNINGNKIPIVITLAK